MTMTINGSGTIIGLSAGGLPSATINQTNLNTNVAGNGPAFSAYMTNGSANQSLTSSTWTKVKIDTKEFDTNTNFDTTTNYRFTPTVAGYYQISGSAYVNASSNPVNVATAIYKNGTSYKLVQTVTAANYGGYGISALVYFNGTTDYVELYVYAGAGTGDYVTYGSTYTWFTGAMVRAA